MEGNEELTQEETITVLEGILAIITAKNSAITFVRSDEKEIFFVKLKRN